MWNYIATFLLIFTTIYFLLGFCLLLINNIKFERGKPLYKWDEEKKEFVENYVNLNFLKKLILKLNLQ